MFVLYVWGGQYGKLDMAHGKRVRDGTLIFLNIKQERKKGTAAYRICLQILQTGSKGKLPLTGHGCRLPLSVPGKMSKEGTTIRNPLMFPLCNLSIFFSANLHIIKSTYLLFYKFTILYIFFFIYLLFFITSFLHFFFSIYLLVFFSLSLLQI